ncbi:MAG: glycosyltransferase family 4 protein [Nitrospiraceae bacterium]|nr:glycosyltransferase family 4 protein [Nitrospiraceae bacterium]
MKLVHITTVPQSLRFVSGQPAFMRAHGIDTHAVSSPGEVLAEFGRSEGCPVYGVEMPRRITPLQDVGALRRLWRYLRRLQPQIVHAHTPKGGLLGMLAARLARVPIRVYHMHGLPFLTATGLKRRLLMITERWSCRLATDILCVSPSVRAAAISLRLCPPSKIKVLLRGSCNGVDAAQQFNPERAGSDVRASTRRRLGIPVDALVIGFIGRLAKAKGLVELEAAWRLLREAYPTLHLMLVGPEEPNDPPPAAVLARLRSDRRVCVVGEDWNTPPLYRAMDILVLPTHREGFPVVLLEAASMALPIVATRVTGCQDAVQDGLTGTLVAPYAAEVLAGGVHRYLRDPLLRQRHGEAARAWVLQDFNPKAMCRAIYEEYVQALESRGLDTPPGCDSHDRRWRWQDAEQLRTSKSGLEG